MGEKKGFRSICSSCSRPILWAITEKGKYMPLDETPNSQGTFTLVKSGEDPSILRAYHEKSRRFREYMAKGGKKYIFHMTVCEARSGPGQNAVPQEEDPNADIPF